MKQNNSVFINIFTDGGARGNPGPSALGVFIEDERGNEIISIGKTLGINTNNYAEYSAIEESLKFVKKNLNNFPSLKKINMYMDSNLAASQLNGLFKIKNSTIREFVLEIKSLENEIKIPISYTHIPRERNKKADAMVNKALDSESTII